MKVVHEGGPSTPSRWWSMDWGSVLCIYPSGAVSMKDMLFIDDLY